MRPASEAPCTLFWPRSGCSPVPGRPIWPVISASAIRQRALSVPWVCCDTPMPQKMIDALGAGIGARDLAQRVGLDAADRRHLLRREVLDVLLPGVEALDVGLDVLLVVELLARR